MPGQPSEGVWITVAGVLALAPVVVVYLMVKRRLAAFVVIVLASIAVTARASLLSNLLMPLFLVAACAVVLFAIATFAHATAPNALPWLVGTTMGRQVGTLLCCVIAIITLDWLTTHTPLLDRDFADFLRGLAFLLLYVLCFSLPVSLLLDPSGERRRRRQAGVLGTVAVTSDGGARPGLQDDATVDIPTSSPLLDPPAGLGPPPQPNSISAKMIRLPYSRDDRLDRAEQDRCGSVDRRKSETGLAGAEHPLTGRPHTIEVGTVVAGRYTLLQHLGEGGMGEVWVASQSTPVRRNVALKLIKRGMDSRTMLARFRQEQQALAVMDHPNLAKVLDAGEANDGRHFFAMELVEGIPLTQYCDGRKLPIRERVELFVSVCQAVRHAHERGVVHRDLKPNNILVATYDGHPVPKVIDFGVAKATGHKLIEETLATEVSEIIGTLEYMAPEQAVGGSGAPDVDIRADIYALGVVLHELLTGVRPFDSFRLRRLSIDQAVRVLQNEEPLRPSARMSVDGSLSWLASVRGTSNPDALLSHLRRELDWVVLKCLAKGPEDRYETVAHLARDLEHYLANEPVEAKLSSAPYRQLCLRRRAAVLAASLLLVTLGGAAASIAWATARATQAVAARNHAAMAKHMQTATHSDVSRVIASAVDQIDLRVDTPGQEPPADRLSDRLALETSRLEHQAGKDTLRVAVIQEAMGLAQLELGRADRAVPLLTRARATRAVVLGVHHPDTVRITSTLEQLGSVRAMGGRSGSRELTST